MSGKGSKQRPTNLEAFSANYDAIFGKKDNTGTDKNEYFDVLTTEQALTEVVRFNEDNNLYEVDQVSKNLINE